jgi:hypothetical protein
MPRGKNQLCQRGTAVSPLTAETGAHGVTRPTVGEGVLAAMQYNHDHLVWHCRLCLLIARLFAWHHCFSARARNASRDHELEEVRGSEIRRQMAAGLF